MTTLVAIEDLYRRRYAAFLRVGWAVLGDRERAHDAVQEAFARAVKARGDYRGGGQLESWLWAIFANVCRDVLRVERVAPPPEGQARTNGQSETWPELRAAVAALPERQRLAVFLRYYADLDYSAIAAVLGVERGTVAASLHAARAAPKSTMEVTP